MNFFPPICLCLKEITQVAIKPTIFPVPTSDQPPTGMEQLGTAQLFAGDDSLVAAFTVGQKSSDALGIGIAFKMIGCQSVEYFLHELVQVSSV